MRRIFWIICLIISIGCQDKIPDLDARALSVIDQKHRAHTYDPAKIIRNMIYCPPPILLKDKLEDGLERIATECWIVPPGISGCDIKDTAQLDSCTLKAINEFVRQNWTLKDTSFNHMLFVNIVYDSRGHYKYIRVEGISTPEKKLDVVRKQMGKWKWPTLIPPLYAKDFEGEDIDIYMNIIPQYPIDPMITSDFGSCYYRGIKEDFTN